MVDDEAIASILAKDDDVTAIYRVGSRADGTNGSHSDYDYMALHDSDTHYVAENNTGIVCARLDVMIDKVHFTRKDLE